jgi:hypothetical protein
MSEIIIEEINSKKPQSEAVKRAKTKYYSKKNLDPEFMVDVVRQVDVWVVRQVDVRPIDRPTGLWVGHP